MSQVQEDTGVRQQLQKAGAEIQAAREALGRGEIVKLGGMQATVDRACAASAKLPAEQAQRLLPAMEALVDQLNGLEGQLRQHVDALGSGENARQRARAAYRPAGD